MINDEELATRNFSEDLLKNVNLGNQWLAYLSAKVQEKGLKTENQ